MYGIKTATLGIQHVLHWFTRAVRMGRLGPMSSASLPGGSNGPWLPAPDRKGTEPRVPMTAPLFLGHFILVRRVSEDYCKCLYLKRLWLVPSQFFLSLWYSCWKIFGNFVRIFQDQLPSSRCCEQLFIKAWELRKSGDDCVGSDPAQVGLLWDCEGLLAVPFHY